MQISNRFTISVHICLCLLVFQSDHKTTSDFLAQSVGTNPVIIRQCLHRLQKAGLVKTKRGSGGSVLAQKPETITLLDIYRACEPYPSQGLFRFHDSPSPDCPVGRQIEQLLEDPLQKAQMAMEARLASVSMKDLAEKADFSILQQEENPLPDSEGSNRAPSYRS